MTSQHLSTSNGPPTKRHQAHSYHHLQHIPSAKRRSERAAPLGLLVPQYLPQSAQPDVLRDAEGPTAIVLEPQGTAVWLHDAEGTNANMPEPQGTTVLRDAEGTNAIVLEPQGTAFLRDAEGTDTTILEFEPQGTTVLCDVEGTNTIMLEPQGTAVLETRSTAVLETWRGV